MENALRRVVNIAANHTPAAADTFVSYLYFGAGGILKVGHPGVSGGLNLTYGSGSSYAAFDRFDRIIDQNWATDAGGAVVCQQHKFDRAGRKVYSDDLVLTAAKDEFFDYDNLDRLLKYRQGNLSSTKTGVDGTPKGQNQYGTSITSRREGNRES